MADLHLDLLNVNARQLYIDRVSAITSAVGAAQSTFNTTIGNITSLINAYNNTTLTVDPTTINYPGDYTPGDVGADTKPTKDTAPTLPSAPTLTDVSVTAPSYPTVPTAPADNAYEDIPVAPAAFDPTTLPDKPTEPSTVGVIAPTLVMPGAPVVSISYTEDVSHEGIYTNLIAAINNGLLTSKILTEAEEQAMYDRSVARTDLEHSKAESDAVNYWASRGFETPGMQVTARLAELTAERLRNTNVINAEVLAKSAELAMQSMNVAIDAAAKVEATWMTYINSMNDRQANLAAESVKQIVAVYAATAKAKTDEFLGRVQMFDTEFKAILQQYDTEMRGFETESNVILQTYTGEVQAYNALVTAIANKNKAIIDRYTSAANAYSAVVRAESDRFTGEVSGKSMLEKSKAELYVAEVQGTSTAIKATVDAFASEMAAWATGVKADVDVEQLKLQALEIQGRMATAQKEIVLKDFDLRLREANASLATQLEALGRSAGTTAQIIASTLGAAHTTLGYSVGASMTENVNMTQTGDIYKTQQAA